TAQRGPRRCATLASPPRSRSLAKPEVGTRRSPTAASTCRSGGPPPAGSAEPIRCRKLAIGLASVGRARGRSRGGRHSTRSTYCRRGARDLRVKKNGSHQNVLHEGAVSHERDDRKEAAQERGHERAEAAHRGRPEFGVVEALRSIVARAREED